MWEYLIITKSWPPPQQPRPIRPPPPLCNNLIPSRYLGEQWEHTSTWSHRDIYENIEMRGYSFKTQGTFTFNISDFVLFGPQSWVCGVQVLLSNTGWYHFNIKENINEPPLKFVIGSPTIRKKYGQEAPSLLRLVSLHLGEKTHTHILKAMHLNGKGGLEQ